MTCDYKLVVSVECKKSIDLGIHLSLNTVESLIKAYMNTTAVAKVIAGPCCFKIEDPIGCIDTASECNYDALIFWRISQKAINAITIIADNLWAFKFYVFAIITVPIFDRSLRLISNCCKMG